MQNAIAMQCCFWYIWVSKIWALKMGFLGGDGWDFLGNSDTESDRECAGTDRDICVHDGCMCFGDVI